MLYTYSHGCVHVLMCTHMCGDQRLTSAVFLNCFPSWFFESESLMETRAHWLGRLADHGALGTQLTLPRNGFMGTRCHIQLFMKVSRI